MKSTVRTTFRRPFQFDMRKRVNNYIRNIAKRARNSVQRHLTAIILLTVVPSTITVSYYSIEFNTVSYDQYLRFVIGVMAVSGVILSIGLTVFQSMLSDVAKTYNPHIQKLFKKEYNQTHIFYCFVVAIIACISFILVPKDYYEWTLCIIFTLFVTTLVFFATSMNKVLDSRNSISVIEFLHDSMTKEIEDNGK